MFFPAAWTASRQHQRTAEGGAPKRPGVEGGGAPLNARRCVCGRIPCAAGRKSRRGAWQTSSGQRRARCQGKKEGGTLPLRDRQRGHRQSDQDSPLPGALMRGGRPGRHQSGERRPPRQHQRTAEGGITKRPGVEGGGTPKRPGVEGGGAPLNARRCVCGRIPCAKACRLGA